MATPSRTVTTMLQVSGQSWGQTARTVLVTLALTGIVPPRSIVEICQESVNAAPGRTTFRGLMNASPRIFALFAIVVLVSGATALRAEDKDKAPKQPEPIGDKHFRLYDGKGKSTSLENLLGRMRTVDVVFLGESHDDPVAHSLQARLLRRANEQRANRPLALSLEMFERDVQPVLDEYLLGLITEQ